MYGLRKNLFSDGMNQLLGVIFPIFIQYYIIRKLNLADIGYINIINAGYSIVSLFSGFSLIYLVREISGATDASRCNTLIINSIALTYCIVAIPLLGMVLWLASIQPQYHSLIFILAIPIITSPLAADYYLQATLKNDLILYRRLGSKILAVVLVLIFVREERDFYAYALIISLTASLEHVINFIYIRNKMYLSLLSFRVMTEIFINSIKYIPFRLAYNTLPHYSILIGASFFSVHTIAVFSILFKLINLATTFVTSSVMVIFPYRNKIRAEVPDLDFAAMNRVYLRNTVVVSVGVAALILSFQDVIFNIFLNGQTIPNLSLEFSILASFVMLHSVFNYIVFNYYLAANRIILVTILSAMKVAIFVSLLYGGAVLGVKLQFSTAVIISTATPLIILILNLYTKRLA